MVRTPSVEVDLSVTLICNNSLYRGIKNIYIYIFKKSNTVLFEYSYFNFNFVILSSPRNMYLLPQ